MPKIKHPPKYARNPEYASWRREQLRKNPSAWDYPHEDRFPEDYGKKLPDEGSWIILLAQVNVGRKIDEATELHICVPHLSCWYALPVVTKGGLHQAIIQHPEGQVHIWPHEYQLFNLEKFLEFTEEDGFIIHFLSETSGFNEAAMFYIRSRGISKADAQRMLLPTLKDPNYCYFQFSDECREFFPEWTGTPYGAIYSRRTL